MKRIPIPITFLIFLAHTSVATASDPVWWATRGVITAAPQSNLSPATIGQAKHMVSMALAELQPRVSTASFQALQADVSTIMSLATPSTQADFTKQKQILLVGQLKAVARPFYDRLRALDAPWVNQKMYQSSICILEPGSNPLSYSPYPWTIATNDDSNYSAATLGQLKAAFSLHFEEWGIPEPADPPLPSGPYDTDGDGLSDITEIAMGTSPTLSDSDGDGYSDSVDAFPLDPSRWQVLTSNAGDLTPPQIVLDSPATATYVAGP